MDASGAKRRCGPCRGIGRVIVDPGDPRLGEELARPEGRLLTTRRITITPSSGGVSSARRQLSGLAESPRSGVFRPLAAGSSESAGCTPSACASSVQLGRGQRAVSEHGSARRSPCRLCATHAWCRVLKKVPPRGFPSARRRGIPNVSIPPIRGGILTRSATGLSGHIGMWPIGLHIPILIMAGQSPGSRRREATSSAPGSAGSPRWRHRRSGARPRL